ncbi:MAG TPA: cupin domain-containing protein [Candidatus Elarobacter sp.]|nr:cupin domain-containing protein [Candidatus Elarobacter sp.]
MRGGDGLMRQTVVPGVWSWSRWQPDRGLDFNGFFCEHADGNLVVDPVEPDDETLAALRERGVAAVLVTNRDHERFSATVAEALRVPVIASALDAPLLARAPERTVEPGERIFGWTVLGFDGLKTAGEIALGDRVRDAVLVGDALWGKPAGALTVMPKVADPDRAALSLRALRARHPSHVLVGDGACVFGNGYDAIGAAVEACGDVLASRVNVDELPFWRGSGDAAPFTAAFAEVGWLIGADALAYAAGTLRRGEHYCPYHWHTAEEEAFVVMRGTPTVRTPRGEFVLRAGDVVAFPANSAGAHRLWNDAEEDAVVLMFAKADRGDVCYYPDSEKFVVEATGTLVREHPQLDYFEGEAPARPKER